MTNDLISRQAAIEHLKKRLYETALNNVTEHPYYEEMADNRVSVWLKEVPSAQPRWIPVAEALPRDDEDVIVTCLDDSGDTPYSYTAVAWHYNGTWVCDNMRCPFVIAWMPLPEPYKEGQDGTRD